MNGGKEVGFDSGSQEPGSSPRIVNIAILLSGAYLSTHSDTRTQVHPTTHCAWVFSEHCPFLSFHCPFLSFHCPFLSFPVLCPCLLPATLTFTPLLTSCRSSRSTLAALSLTTLYLSSLHLTKILLKCDGTGSRARVVRITTENPNH
jgi:hypothetical protein